MADLQRPSPEIERRLRKVEQGVQQVKSPIGHDGTSWVSTTESLYIAYASALTNLGADGKIPTQSDATDFGYTPFTPAGVLLAYRGRLTSTSTYASGDPTDYIWETTGGISGTGYSRYYTESSDLLVNLGDPDSPGAGITWVSISPSVALPGSAFWVADKYTVEGVESGWEIYPIKTGTSGNLGLISYTKSGSNKPVLNDATWQADVLLAASAFTGLAYSSHTELGHGATVAITYDNGKLYGTLKEVASVDTWVTATAFIDGDLVVDGTITADQIAANAITADKIAANAITADKIAAGSVTSTKVNLVPADVGAGSSSSSGERLLISSNRIDIYDASNNLRIRLGEL